MGAGEREPERGIFCEHETNIWVRRRQRQQQQPNSTFRAHLLQPVCNFWWERGAFSLARWGTNKRKTLQANHWSSTVTGWRTRSPLRHTHLSTSPHHHPLSLTMNQQLLPNSALSSGKPSIHSELYQWLATYVCLKPPSRQSLITAGVHWWFLISSI